MAKPTRHRYSAEYKVRILREADAVTGPGEIGALLRREGLYSSNLTAWRKQREKGELEGLSQKRRGPLPKENNPLADKVKALESETARLRARAERPRSWWSSKKKSPRYWNRTKAQRREGLIEVITEHRGCFGVKPICTVFVCFVLHSSLQKAPLPYCLNGFYYSLLIRGSYSRYSRLLTIAFSIIPITDPSMNRNTRGARRSSL